MSRYFALCVFVCVFSVSSVQATTYYVSTQGRDKNNGTAPNKAWRSIDRVNKQDLNAGDKVLFQGGQTFTGKLYLPKSDSGSIAAPVTISSYGNGVATIASGGDSGLFGYNVSNVSVSNLRFVGATTSKDGLSFYTDQSTGADHVTISGVETTGYQNGVEMGAWNTTAGYRTVRIMNSQSYQNAKNGVGVYAQYVNQNADIYLAQMTMSYNGAHGMVLGGVNGATVENSLAFENGQSPDSKSGPVGIFAYDSTNVLFQTNTVHHTRTSGTDGDGFDFGQNVTNSTMQYNTSYQNAGVGYLLDHGAASGKNSGNTIQDNTSTNDGRTMPYGAIQVWGRVEKASIQRNTVTLAQGAQSYSAAMMLANWGVLSNCVNTVTISGNSFTTTGPKLLIATPELLSCSTDIRLQGNTWNGSPFLILWGSKNYTDLQSWTTATGQN